MPNLLREHSEKWLKPAWCFVLGLAAIYLVVVQPLERSASLGATGLGAVAGPISLRQGPSWQRMPSSNREAQPPRSISVHLGGETARANLAEAREVIRTSSLDLIVVSPDRTAEKIRIIADRFGGYLESSQVNRNQDSPMASITIRIPAARSDDARAEIRKLAARVESETAEAKDVTKEYVDRQARLRNLRAEEEQYLAIMKHTTSVKDTLEVSGKLSEVRGEIETERAEFDALSKQVEMVALSVQLGAPADAQVLGLNWRPLYELKLAFRNGLEGLASYASFAVSVLFYLPAILLWALTLLATGAAGWRILLWARRLFFVLPHTKAAS
jgi:hypothetical protein